MAASLTDTEHEGGNALDPEKQDTAHSTIGTTRSDPRVTRMQALIRRNTKDALRILLLMSRPRKLKLLTSMDRTTHTGQSMVLVKRIAKKKVVKANVKQSYSARSLSQPCFTSS